MSEKKKKKGGSSFPDLGVSDFEGLLLLIAIVAAIGLGWVIVELLAPMLVLVACMLVLAALRRVANDRHDCQGNLPRALLWGALWATLYTLPLGAVVLIVHWAIGR